MGACNFGKSEYPTLGMIIDYPDDERILDYRQSCLNDDENDENSENFYDDERIIDILIDCDNDYQKEIFDEIVEFVSDFNYHANNNNFGFNPLSYYLENSIFTFQVETGYHNGFRIVIINDYMDRHGEVDILKAYEADKHDLPNGFSDDDYIKCYKKMEKFFIFSIREFAKLNPFLKGISGGWCGGEYELSENENSLENEKFKAEFYNILRIIARQNSFCYINLTKN